MDHAYYIHDVSKGGTPGKNAKAYVSVEAALETCRKMAATGSYRSMTIVDQARREILSWEDIKTRLGIT